MAGRPAMIIHGTTDSTLLPARLAGFVLSVLGLTSYPTFASDAVHTPKLGAGQRPSAVQTGSLTPEDFASQYNLNPLYKKGATGAGSTIGIVTLASVDPATPEFFWSNILGINTKANRITLDNVDGGSGPVTDASGSGETTLDVEQSGALAPDANIVVYQAPNTDFGFVDGFFTAASQNVADSVSASWGESETEIQASVAAGLESSTYAISFDEAFLEMADQGQSAFPVGRRLRRLHRDRGPGHHQPVGRKPGQQPLDHHRRRHHAGRHDPADRDRLGDHRRPAHLGLGLAVAALR